MKHSPLCMRDDGKEIMFTAKDGDTKYRFVLSRELLDETCGVDASEAERKKWVGTQLADILTARHGTDLKPPFDRVHVEEIK